MQVQYTAFIWGYYQRKIPFCLQSIVWELRWNSWKLPDDAEYADRLHWNRWKAAVSFAGDGSCFRTYSKIHYGK